MIRYSFRAITMQLNNRYFIMRHGESEANRAGIIVSDPRIGAESYGLTDEGRAQVRSSLRGAAAAATIIYTSDFARARETAGLSMEHFRLKEFHITHLLRERFIGHYDGKDDRFHNDIREMDGEDPAEYPGGIAPLTLEKIRAKRFKPRSF